MFQKVYEELERLGIRQISNYEAIPVVKDFICPYCNGSGDGFHHVPGEGYVSLPEARIIGYCETPSGFMCIYECTQCFKKFRYHGCTSDRWDKEKFLVRSVFPVAKCQEKKYGGLT